MLNLLKDILPVALWILAIVAIVYLILLPFIASWKLFKKVGIPGWKSLIPVYNQYLIYKISGMPGIFAIPYYAYFILDIIYPDFISPVPQYMFITIIVLSAIVFILDIIKGIKLSNYFGKGTLFKIGMILIPEIFEIIVGMGKAKYNGPYKVKNKNE